MNLIILACPCGNLHIIITCVFSTDLFLSSNRLRVVPLFETVTDLRGAGLVIRKLLSIDWYREHIIKNHNGHQEVCVLCREFLDSVICRFHGYCGCYRVILDR